MVVVLLVLLVGSLFVGAAFAAVEGDVKLTHTNAAADKAYSAAQVGLQVYTYELSANPSYWTTCPSKERHAVPGSPEETYTYETLPATGSAKCESGKPATIIESRSSANGSFRIKATGESGNQKRSLVATFAHAGFLNYVYFTNYEILDPSARNPEPLNCEHYWKYREEHGLRKECGVISFAPTDKVNGPMHTNDAAAICAEGASEPTFGRTSLDKIEMNEGHYGSGGSCTNNPNIVGTYTEKAPTLLPPETDSELLESAGYIFTGKTIIELKAGSPNTMAVTLSNGTKETKNFPANGVIYDNNAAGGCPIKYSPFATEYGTDTNCGNVYIKGTYTESLTVGAANDVIVFGNLTTSSEGSGKPTGVATLGLIATNFVRVYHPVQSCAKGGCENNSSKCTAANLNAKEDPNGWGSLENPVIDAAILSTHHSWIVDNYLCGKGMGQLTVWGGIAQFWRGPVGTVGASGYVKNYNYDDRLETDQPPDFLAPTTTGGWKIEREVAPAE